MKFQRTIVETTVYTEVVEAKTAEEAAGLPINVKTVVNVGDKPGAVRDFSALLVKTACVGRVEAKP